MVEIIKASGNKVVFNKNRIEKTALRAGASKELAKKIANEVSNKIRDGMHTQKILELILKSLKKYPGIAARYDLKRAIMLLGPSGFPFEEFLAQVLQHYGYQTKTGIKLSGKNISQEIDIFATKKLSHMIEAKYHNRLGIHTDTKVAMYTYARFLDIKSNKKNKVDAAWLITNTRCTDNAIKYAKGVKLKVTGWAYPKEEPLQKIIEAKGLYPITILKSLDEESKQKLFLAKIVLAKDLADHSLEELFQKTRIQPKKLDKILKETKVILGV